MSRENRIYENMQAIAKALATDPETNDRYEKATKGSREWFCFSRLVAEAKTRWNDAAAAEYREALVDRLVSTDIAYVLQYETNPKVVAYLKKWLVAADLPARDGDTSHLIPHKRRKVGWGGRFRLAIASTLK